MEPGRLREVSTTLFLYFNFNVLFYFSFLFSLVAENLGGPVTPL